MSDKKQVVDSTLRTTSTDGIPAESLTAADTAGQRAKRSGKDITNLLIRTIAPVLLALIAGALILLAMGKDPLFFYGNIINYGIMGRGWQQSLVMMTPLLLMAAGLIVVFRGKLWNLGYDAQYLLAAVLVIGFAPTLNAVLPWWLTLIVLTLLGIVVGAAWTIVPAFLKARFETNEIITTLMMSFIGVGIANLLVRGPFHDPDKVVPQTQAIPLDSMLPFIPGTRVHVGLIVAIVVVLILHWVLTRTSFGLRLDIFGANPKTAMHVGIDTSRMIVTLFIISGGLIGLAAAMDMLGLWGYVRSNWNPEYGAAVIPFVFLARLNVLGSIPFVAFYAIVANGGQIAAQDSDLSTDFILVLIALILIFMSIIEYVGTRRDLGQSYLPPGLKTSVAQLFGRKKSS